MKRIEQRLRKYKRKASIILSLGSHIMTRYFPGTSVWQCVHSIANQGSSPEPWHSEFLLSLYYIGKIDWLPMWLVSVSGLTETMWPKVPTLNPIVVFLCHGQPLP